MPISSPLAQKLWRVADIQGHRDPFSERMLSMTTAQLDFVLECYAADHPNEYTFSRHNTELAPSQVTTTWFNVLRGSALERFMASRINHAAMRAKAAKAKAQAATFGLRGRGKAAVEPVGKP